MVFLIIGLIALGSLTADRLVWLRLRAQWPAQRWPRRVYGVVMGLCYAAVAVALAFFRAKSDGESTRALHWILWAIGLFCVVTLPKLFILLGAGVDGVRWCFVRSPRRVGFRVGVWCALLCLGVMVWGVTGGRNRIVERPVTLTSSRLPAAFDGYRILFFSDVHIGNLPANGRFLHRVVARVERAQPDLVLCGGDLVNIDVRELTDSVQATLSQIHAPDG
ncbi:MAG: metallophosphoesterase, partial [Alistipes sp.]|nr:metallophosphoesterase [Alistipes sp.]